MKVYFFLVLINFVLVFSHLDKFKNYIEQVNDKENNCPLNINFIDEELNDPIQLLFKKLTNLFESTLNNTINDLSSECISSIRFLLEKNNSNYLWKFLEDSANNKNDLDSFLTCKNTIPDDNIKGYTEYYNLTYAVLQVDKKNWISRADIRYVSGKYLLGICIRKGCSELEYRQFLFQMNIEMNDPLLLKHPDEIEVFDLDNHKRNFNYTIFIYLIPVYFLLIQSLFTCFPEIPAFLCCCCFRKNKKNKLKNKLSQNDIFDKLKYLDESFNSNEDEDKNTDEFSFTVNTNESVTKKLIQKEKLKTKKSIISNTDENKLYQFKSSFNFTDNMEDFFSIDSSKGNNESGMSNLKGLRGFSMIFMIIGHIYLYLLVSPLKIYSEFQHRGLMTSAFYGIILFGMRYAPRVLIACSGFSLAYKLFCYLDEIVESDNKNSFLENNNTNDKSPSKLIFLKEQELFVDDTRTDYEELKWIHFFKFILYQGYKYLIFVLFVCFYRFSFYEVVNMFYDPGPMWVYLKRNIIDEIKLNDLLGIIFLYHPYTNSNIEILNVFWIPFNEITFFIISTIIIFICYKKNYRMDIILIILYLILIIYKICYYLIFNDPQLYPILGNYTDGNANFYTSPIYNYTFFLIGISFGKVNYVIQKSINSRKIMKSGKTYLTFQVYFVKFYKENRNTKVIAVTIFGIAVLIFLVMSYPILYTIIGTDAPDKFLENFNKNQSLNIFYLIDTEIFTFILFIVFTSLFILGDNFFVDFFTHDYWSFISRSYYSFILISDIFILYIYYQSESRMKLEIFNILFFALFTVSLIGVLSIIVHIIFEMPYKKINKNFWGAWNKVREKENLSIKNKSSFINENSLNSVNKSSIFS